jgi:hypothetical protein
MAVKILGRTDLSISQDRFVLEPGFDFDALVYIQNVEAADGQALEGSVRKAINRFVIGLKQDNLWTALKSSAILSGARTLTGALIPLVGTAPTNFNFVPADYNRKTGLLANGSTKYLDTNRNNNADSQDSKHGAVYISTASTSSSGANSFPAYVGTGASATGAFVFGRLSSNSVNFFARLNNSTADTIAGADVAVGFAGMSRSASGSYTFRTNGASSTITRASQTPFNGNIGVFREGAGGATGSTYSNARLAFYSIGEAVDLSLFDSHVARLISDFDAAI